MALYKTTAAVKIHNCVLLFLLQLPNVTTEVIESTSHSGNFVHLQVIALKTGLAGCASFALTD